MRSRSGKLYDHSRWLNAAETCDKQTINEMLLQGADDYDGAMQLAAEGGCADIASQMGYLGWPVKNWVGWPIVGTNLHYMDFDHAMMSAAKNGHADVVDAMLDRGAHYYDIALMYAGQNGHMDIVDKLIESGARCTRQTICDIFRKSKRSSYGMRDMNLLDTAHKMLIKGNTRCHESDNELDIASRAARNGKFDIADNILQLLCNENEWQSETRYGIPSGKNIITECTYKEVSPTSSIVKCKQFNNGVCVFDEKWRMSRNTE